MLQYIFEIHGQITRFFLILEILRGFFGDSLEIFEDSFGILEDSLRILCGFLIDISADGGKAAPPESPTRNNPPRRHLAAADDNSRCHALSRDHHPIY